MEPFTNLWSTPKRTRIFTHNIFDITLPPVAGLLGWRLQLSSCSKCILHPVTTSLAQSTHIYFPPLLLKGPLWTIFITQNHLCPAELLSRGIPFFSSHGKCLMCVCFYWNRQSQTALRVSGVTGSVLFCMLCNSRCRPRKRFERNFLNLLIPKINYN